MVQRPTRDRPPIGIVDLGSRRRYGAGLDEGSEPLGARGSSRRDSRDLAASARAVAATELALRDRLDRREPPRIPALWDGRPLPPAAGEQGTAAEAEPVVCSCHTGCCDP
jgi:hypothetical protein